MNAPPYSAPPPSAPPFWSRGWLWGVLAGLSLVPSLGVTILPFGDLMNHLGRHTVFLQAAGDPFLRRFYAVHWFLIGNLGVDLPVRAIGPWLGAEAATRLVVGCTPALTIAGIWALGRSLHGRVPAAALAGAPLAFAWPFLTGFANFCLAAALALLVLALWIRLRALAWGWRLAIFAPLGFVVWVAHTAGWGLLSLGVGAYELARAARPWRGRAILLAPVQATPFALMLVVTMLWRTGHGGAAPATHYSPGVLKDKAATIASLFREHLFAWDVAALAILAGLIGGFFLAGGRRLDWRGGAIALAFLLAFALCPQIVFNSGFADRRLLPFALIALATAIPDGRATRATAVLAGIAIAFFAARIATSTLFWHAASQRFEQRLALIDRVPRHSRLFALAVDPCATGWDRLNRAEHLQQYALPRRTSAVNGMFNNPGLNQVEMLSPRDGGSFDPRMYAVIRDARCPQPYIRTDLQRTMAAMRRPLFDYVWIVAEEAPGGYDTSGLQPVAQQGYDRLYRVVPAAR